MGKSYNLIVNSRSVREIYDTHKRYDVLFNKSVINALGLIADKVSLKCEDLQIPAILFSTSMVSAKVLAKLSQNCIDKIKDNSFKTTLRYTFYVEDLGQSISFYVNSKISKYSIYDGDKPNIFLLSLDFTRMPPRIFIEILGEYIYKQENRHKRAVERVSISSEKIESFIFKDGSGKKCLLTEISLFSAKILVTGDSIQYTQGENILLIMKSKELKGLGEMIGELVRIEEIGNDLKIVSLIVNFHQDKIPPAYKMWVAECIQNSRI